MQTSNGMHGKPGLTESESLAGPLGKRRRSTSVQAKLCATNCANCANCGLFNKSAMVVQESSQKKKATTGS